MFGIGMPGMLNPQNTIAMAELLPFQRILPTVVLDRYQDWQFRQRFQYEALVGHITDDFVSIDDFIKCMDVTQVNMADKLAWKLYRKLVPYNPFFRRKLAWLPSMGWVGKTLATFSLAGFTRIFTDAVGIIRDRLPSGDS